MIDAQPLASEVWSADYPWLAIGCKPSFGPGRTLCPPMCEHRQRLHVARQQPFRVRISMLTMEVHTRPDLLLHCICKMAYTLALLIVGPPYPVITNCKGIHCQRIDGCLWPRDTRCSSNSETQYSVATPIEVQCPVMPTAAQLQSQIRQRSD